MRRRRTECARHAMMLDQDHDRAEAHGSQQGDRQLGVAREPAFDLRADLTQFATLFPPAGLRGS